MGFVWSVPVSCKENDIAKQSGGVQNRFWGGAFWYGFSSPEFPPPLCFSLSSTCAFPYFWVGALAVWVLEPEFADPFRPSAWPFLHSKTLRFTGKISIFEATLAILVARAIRNPFRANRSQLKPPFL